MKLETLLNSLGSSEQNSISSFDVANRFADVDLTGGDFVGSSNVLVFSGPPLLDQALKNKEILRPVGLINSLGISVNKQYFPWTEMGYKYMRAVPHKISYNLNMGRLIASSGDIMFALYQWAIVQMKRRGLIDANINFSEEVGVNPEDPNSNAKLDSFTHFHNLGSEFFNMPFGLLLISMNNYYKVLSTEYVELCKVLGKGKQISDSPITMENIQILATRIRPAKGLKVSSASSSGKKKPYYVITPELTYNDYYRDGTKKTSSPNTSSTSAIETSPSSTTIQQVDAKGKPTGVVFDTSNISSPQTLKTGEGVVTLDASLNSVIDNPDSRASIDKAKSLGADTILNDPIAREYLVGKGRFQDSYEFIRKYGSF